MENAPEAPAAAPAVESEATPNINPTPAPAAPDMHGFTSDQLADMKKFFDSQGGYEKVKSRISNPQNYSEPVHKIDQTPTQAVDQTPTQAVQPQAQSEQPAAYRAPFGSITREELLAQEYANILARDPGFEPISGDISSGAFLKDMSKLGIRLVNPDGSFNDGQVREYLRLRAATVAAKQTSAVPEASAAPTVEYSPYDEKTMDMKQAMAILQQDSALKSHGQAGHPHASDAENFMRKFLNKSSK